MKQPGETTTQAGYGHRHQMLRLRFAPRVAAGGDDLLANLRPACARCNRGGR